jgi:ABC-type Fe3+-siderophore transport system permease subunit
MASSEFSGNAPDRTVDHGRRTNPMGAYVATAGVVIFTISVFLDWIALKDQDDTARSGYETDPVIPFAAYLGIGLVVALFYALSRARGKQHRGLTLTTMAAGIAVVLLALSYMFDAPGALDSELEFQTEFGTWIALLGGIVWSVGAGLLAKEPEGDDDWNDTHAVAGTRRGH